MKPLTRSACKDSGSGVVMEPPVQLIPQEASRHVLVIPLSNFCLQPAYIIDELLYDHFHFQITDAAKKCYYLCFFISKLKFQLKL